MAVHTLIESAAASAVGTNLMSGKQGELSGMNRRIVRIGVVGSTNPGDSAVKILYGGEFIGEFYNTTGGANKTPVDTDMQEVPRGKWCNANTPIRVEISDAGATNVLAIRIETLEFDPKKKSYGFRKKSYGYKRTTPGFRSFNPYMRRF